MGVLALDIGGTWIKGAVVDRAAVVATRRFRTGREAGPDSVVETILDAADSLMSVAADEGVDVAAAGLAVLGLVDSKAGVATYSANVGWKDVPLRALAEDRLGVRVGLVNDVNAAGHAESSVGAAAGSPTALVVCIGTGIKAAVVLDGAVHVGASERAGELGQVLVRSPDGDRSMARLESVASATAIEAAYEAATGAQPGSVSAVDVIAAVDFDEVAAEVCAERLSRLCDVLADSVAVLDPERIVIGGGLSHAGEPLLGRLRDGLAARLTWRDVPALVAARFGNDAGWIGAALLAWQLVGDEHDERGRWIDSMGA